MYNEQLEQKGLEETPIQSEALLDKVLPNESFCSEDDEHATRLASTCSSRSPSYTIEEATGTGPVAPNLVWVFSVWVFCYHMWALHELHKIPNSTKIISKMVRK